MDDVAGDDGVGVAAFAGPPVGHGGHGAAAPRRALRAANIYLGPLEAFIILGAKGGSWAREFNDIVSHLFDDGR
eukprot:8340565-Pyramimonas_sp.AAC.1